MYQFTTTNVINNLYLVDYDGNVLLDNSGRNEIPAFVTSDDSSAFIFPKIGTFKIVNIESVYKIPYAAGVKEVATITVPTPVLGEVSRLTVEIKLSQSTQSEFVNYSLDFKKPIVVEIVSSGVAATDAAAFVTQINSLKDRFGHSYFTATAVGAVITLTAKDNSHRFKTITIGKETAVSTSITQYEYPVVATGTVTTPGKVGFGDDLWMMRSVMLPTLENTRQFNISKNERPVLGGNYSQYTLRYSVDKDGTDGIVSGGKSVTTHVFFVKEDLISDFETMLSDVVNTKVLFYRVTTAAGSLSTGADETTQVIVDNAIGAITYSSSDVTMATVNSTGLVTTAGVTGTGPVEITATDSVGNSEPITLTITA